VFPQIVSDYVQTGKIRYVYRNFPLSFHNWAQKAAEAAECAGEQGQYWAMHDALFNGQDEWTDSQDGVTIFKGMAGTLKLDQAKFDSCLDGNKYAQKVQADVQEGAQAGVSGTPAFFINGISLSGAQSFDTFKQKIEYVLAGGEAPSLTVPPDSYRSMGQADAPVVITEFSDYQCPACGYVATTVIPEIIKRYVDTGQVRFVFREFPLSSIHPLAQKAAEAAVCAGKQGHYWEMNETLYANQDKWGADGADSTQFFRDYATKIGLGMDEFNTCLDSGEAALDVQADLLAAESLGADATPYFFIDKIPIRGGLPIEGFSAVIDYVAAGGSAVEPVPVGSWRVLGSTQTARAGALAFVDYADPQSRQHALEVLPQLKQAYIDAGQIVYVVHPWSPGGDTPSTRGAAAAECAGQQGKGWEMHTKLFEEQDKWTQAAAPQPLFTSYAQGLGLDTAKFEQCLSSPETALAVQAGYVIGVMYGVPDAQTYLFSNGQTLSDSPTFAEFKTIIDSMINQ